MKKGDDENHHQSESNVELTVSPQDSDYPVAVHKSKEKVHVIWNLGNLNQAGYHIYQNMIL